MTILILGICLLLLILMVSNTFLVRRLDRVYLPVRIRTRQTRRH